MTTNGHTTPAPSGREELFNAREIVTTLQDLMGRVTKDEASPTTVQAAVNCAAQIAQVLRLHLDARKVDLEERKLEMENQKILRAEQRLMGRS